MKTFSENTRLTLLVLLLLFVHINSGFSQLIYQDGTSSFLQINQPVALDFKISSDTRMSARMEFPVSLLLVNASGARNISLDSGYDELFVRLFEQLSAADFTGIASDAMLIIQQLENSVMPQRWRMALAGAMAMFFWLIAFFAEGKIAGTAGAIARDPAAALFGGFIVVFVLLAAIILSVYSFVGAPLGLILMLFTSLLAVVSPVVVIASVCEIFVPGIKGVKKWTLVAVLSVFVAGLFMIKYAWFSFLPVALALTASSFRNRSIEGESKEVSDEKSV